MHVLAVATHEEGVLYTVGHKVGAFAAHGWVAPLTQTNLDEVFRTLGLRVVERTRGCNPAPAQDCMRLQPVPLASLPSEICGRIAP